MNDYEIKQAARIERMRARAARLMSEAEAAATQRERLLSVIPPGQPILVGHHSERGHRKLIEKIDRTFHKQMAAVKEAETLERRANAAETSDAVSSDDPDAVSKLREKLEKLEKRRELMTAINRALRSKDPVAALAPLGYRPEQFPPDALGRVGFAPYKLSNLRAEIRRVTDRITVLERNAIAAAAAPIVVGDVTIEESENRVRVVFPGKPSDAVRAKLRARGFRWSPTAGAWQRQATDEARYWAKQIMGVL